MIPDNGVIPEVIIQGFDELLRLGFIFINVGCVKAKTLISENVVPVLVARRKEGLNEPCTYMFFGNQAENNEGGMANYILLETLNEASFEIELPRETGELNYLHWNRRVAS